MLGEAIEYPFEGESTLETFLVGGALYLLSPLVVPGILLGGYSVAVVRAVAAGRSDPPSFDDWDRYFTDGLSVLAISIVYWLPGLVLAGIGLSVFAIVTLLGFGGSGAVGAVLFVLMLVGTLVGSAYSLVVAYLLPAAIVNFALTGELSAAWDVDTLRTVAADGEYATAWMGASVVLLVANSVGATLSVVLVGFVVFFYGQVAALYLYARGATAALDGASVPPIPPSAPGADAPDEPGPEGTGPGANTGAGASEGAPGEDGNERPAAEEVAGSAETEAGGADRGLEDVDGVGPATAEALEAAGYESLADLQGATRDDLTAVDGIGPAKADQIKGDVGDA